MSQNLMSKIDTRNPKTVFLVKRRSTIPTAARKTQHGTKKELSAEKLINADLQGIPQPVQSAYISYNFKRSAPQPQLLS